MSGNGLTLFAWIFMLTSMTSVTVLVGWCYYRILNSDSEFNSDSGDSPPDRAEIA